MATYVPPKKNTAFIFYTALVQQADTRLLKSSPTLAAGDFKVSIDGGALNNLATLPTTTPASSVMLKISLSSSEMNGDNITVVCIDAAGAEWCDKVINIQTSARQVDDLAFPATTGRSMVVDASGLVDANAVKIGPTGAGTAQTARDLGASVLLSAGSGAGQLDFTSGVVKANVVQFLGTTSAGVAGYAGIDWSHVNAPTTTVALSGTTVGTLTTYTGNTPQTGDSYARLGAPAGASHAADIAEVEVETDAILAALPSNLSTLLITAGGHISNVDTLTTYAGNTVQTGDSYARIGAPVGASLSADIAEIEGETDSILSGVTVTGTVNANVLQWNSVNVVASNTGGVPVVDTREVFRQGTAQATGNSTTAIKLDAGASATDNYYYRMRCHIISGTGSPQSAVVVGYVGASKIATVFPAWPTAPDNTSVFQLVPCTADLECWAGFAIATPDVAGFPKMSALDAPNMHNDVAQAGGVSTITLAASDTATDNFYLGTRIRIWQGAAIGQARNIIGNVFSTKVATVDRPWGVVPDNTSHYSIESSDEPLLDANGYVTVKGVRPQKNVALANFEFVMVDARGVGVPGLTITVTRSKDKGAYAPADNAGSITDVGGGTYGMDITANDLNAGVVTFHFTAPGAADKWITMVLQT
jgi:hypothetical protein